MYIGNIHWKHCRLRTSFAFGIVYWKQCIWKHKTDGKNKV